MYCDNPGHKALIYIYIYIYHCCQDSLASGATGQPLEEAINAVSQCNVAFKTASKHVLMHTKPAKVAAPKGKGKSKAKAKAKR